MNTVNDCISYKSDFLFECNYIAGNSLLAKESSSLTHWHLDVPRGTMVTPGRWNHQCQCHIFWCHRIRTKRSILKEMYSSQHAPTTDRLDPKISRSTPYVDRSSYLCCSSTLQKQNELIKGQTGNNTTNQWSCCHCTPTRTNKRDAFISPC
jgi:hypothetical protein